MLRHARGNYTEAHINRCSKMGGGFGKEVDRLFNVAMFGGDIYDTKRKKRPKYSQDVGNFVAEFKDEALFDYCPPREYDNFPEYSDISNRIKSPVRFGRHLAALSRSLDFWRHRSENAREPRHDDDADNDDDI